EDLRLLWGLNYFSDVELSVERASGGLVYVVRVTERPAVREVRLSGNDELSKDDLKEAIDVKPFSILDLDAVRRNAKKIQEKYVEKGFFLAEVTHRLEPVPNAPQEVDVVFVIREHSKVMVKEVRFLGAQKVPVADLKAVMATKEGGYLSFITGEGTYREELFQRDLAVIQATYLDRGFVNIKVDKPSVSISADKRYIYIAIPVEEGEQFSIGALDVSGDLLVPKERLRRLMKSRQGQLFNRSLLADDIQGITDIYYDQGYAYANITPLTQVHPENKTIDLTFDIQKGRQVTIERIEMVGNTKTRDRVLRREMRVYEGELFNGTGMKRSKERITALGYFETVEVSHKPGSADDRVVVQVDVKEKATGSFNVGLGFSNNENFIFTAQVSQNNLVGWGQSVSASVQWSKLRQYLQFSFYDPYFLDSNYIFSTTLSRIQIDRFSYIRNSTGGDVGVGYYLFEDFISQLTYTLEYVKVEQRSSQQNSARLPPGLFVNGVNSAARLSFTYDKRNNRLFPSKGFMQFASAELAPSFLGSDFQYARYTAFTRFYIPIIWGFVFKTNANIGYVQQLNPERRVPLSELYQLGGINSIRGYQLNSISPTILVGGNNQADAAVTQFSIGGNKQLTLNFELEFPIFEKVGIRGVFFYDAGNAFSQDEKFFQSRQYDLPYGLFQSAGFGFRWFSPLGPLRFEWGFPLNRRPGIDQPLLFEFTIGNFF
ncbi:MAG TPA: outer membrane protein assembly factor BamA, partial [Myxococcaceae bacterium]|nr:outer membrane protein assembly factor BamA [Myxococcaceae bacterium]